VRNGARGRQGADDDRVVGRACDGRSARAATPTLQALTAVRAAHSANTFAGQRMHNDGSMRA
jgi:hypothetical protein